MNAYHALQEHLPMQEAQTVPSVSMVISGLILPLVLHALLEHTLTLLIPPPVLHALQETTLLLRDLSIVSFAFLHSLQM